MGRPIKKEYIGIYYDHNVFMPAIQLEGQSSGGYILRQVGPNRFLCVSTDGARQGVCTLVDEITGDGQMFMSFQGDFSGNVAKLTNNSVVDFDENVYKWVISGSYGGNVVYISYNHDD